MEEKIQKLNSFTSSSSISFWPKECGFQFHPRILNKILGGRETDDNELIRWAHEDIDEMVILVGDEKKFTNECCFRDVEAMAGEIYQLSIKFRKKHFSVLIGKIFLL